MAENVSTYRRYSIGIPTDEMEALLLKTYESEVKGSIIAYRRDLATTDRLKSIARWMTDPTLKHSLILCGGVGSGKSTTLRAMSKAIEFLKRAAKERKAIDKPEFYAEFSNKNVTTVYDRIQGIQSLTVVSAAVAAKNVDTASKTAFLGIDDLGCESTVIMDYGTRTTPLIDLLFHRYDNKMPTVITTNLDLEDIGKKYDKRLQDRMLEDYDILAFPNPSYRRS